eukprot:COSAG01_NODE_2218_length_8146_cov_7.810015_12_plen_87_part_00
MELLRWAVMQRESSQALASKLRHVKKPREREREREIAVALATDVSMGGRGGGVSTHYICNHACISFTQKPSTFRRHWTHGGHSSSG